ncbi:DMT family transporter [Stutzerimonas urumqiensis]|uniref:DMT family transporter n=1 Tax=Stutzerimonas urumqiensis TaxID=638269 RepID=UPI003BAA248D
MPLFAAGCLALSMLIVGANVAVGKAVVSEVPVVLFAALRFLLASLVLAPGLLRAPVRAGLTPVVARGVLVQAFFGCFLFSLLMLEGVRHTSATSAGIVTSATPSAIALLAWLLLRERIAGRGWAAVLLAALGIAVLHRANAVGETGASAGYGILLILGAVLAEALFAVWSRRLALQAHPWALAFGLNLAGALLFLPLAVPVALDFAWDEPSASTWTLLVGYSLSASVLSFLLWYRGVRQVPAHVAGLFTACIPLGALLAGVVLLGESVRAVQWLGLVLVLLAIALGTRATSSTTSS